jgi:hypothetical protein
MRRVALAWVAVLAIMYFVPFFVYGPASSLGWVEFPAPDAPMRFMLSVLVLKLGIASGFVFLFFLGRSVFSRRWIAYAAAWWLMFAVGEIGEAIGPDYGLSEAFAGILSEAVYVPLSAYVVSRLLGGRHTTFA